MDNRDVWSERIIGIRVFVPLDDENDGDDDNTRYLYMYAYSYTCVCEYGLLSLFNGISTFVSYLIPKWS